MPSLTQQLDTRRALVRAVQELLIQDLYLEVEPPDLDPDAPLFGSGHGLDSIDAVELLVSVEARFAVRMTDDRVETVPLLRTIHTLVDGLQAAGAQP